MRPANPKSNTAGIIGALDTYHLAEREDGICSYCGEYNSELELDGCCPEDKHALPNTLTCRKARMLRALANTQAYERGEVQVDSVNPLEGFAWTEADGTVRWQTLVE